MAEDNFGYGAVDEVSKSGKYLNFRKGDKGKVIQIRLVSMPRYVQQHWVLTSDGKQKPVNCIGEKCPYCGNDVPRGEKIDKTAKWGWIVIDREDEEVKIFTGPTLIARSVKEISELIDNNKKSPNYGKPVWGNPLTFDIQIERTEEPGKAYYKVTPMPEGRGTEITAEEKEKIAKANFNLEDELAGSKESKNTGNYVPNELETVPDEVIDVPDDLGEKKSETGSGPMPF